MSAFDRAALERDRSMGTLDTVQNNLMLIDSWRPYQGDLHRDVMPHLIASWID
jgi:hypothetical protein